MPKDNQNQGRLSPDVDEPIDVTITPGCGNIFADLDLPEPELLLAKAKLSLKIEKLIKERKLTQAQAAKLMSLTQPNVSDLIRGRLDGFTLDRLFRCLEALGQEIEIIVRPKRESEDTGLAVRAA